MRSRTACRPSSSAWPWCGVGACRCACRARVPERGGVQPRLPRLTHRPLPGRRGRVACLQGNGEDRTNRLGWKERGRLHGAGAAAAARAQSYAQRTSARATSSARAYSTQQGRRGRIARALRACAARPTHSGGTRCRPCSRECHQQPRSQAPAPHRHEALAGSGRTSCERHFKAPIEAAARRGAMGGSSCCCKPQRSAGEVEARNATGLLQSSVSSVSRAGWKEHPTGQLFQLAGWSGGVAPPRGGAALGRTLHPPAGSSAP